MKSVELINALKLCLVPNFQLSSESADHPGIDVLVGDPCLAVKQELQHKEQILLREIRFNLTVEDSQKYLLNCAKSLKLNADIVKLAAFLCNDSLVHTNACLHFHAAEIAAGCLLAAFHLLRQKYTIPLEQQPFFPKIPSFSQENIDKVLHLLLEIIEKHDVGQT